MARRYNKEGNAGLGDRRSENLMPNRCCLPNWKPNQGKHSKALLPMADGGIVALLHIGIGDWNWRGEGIAHLGVVQGEWNYRQPMTARLAIAGTLNGSDPLMDFQTHPTQKESNSE